MYIEPASVAPLFLEVDKRGGQKLLGPDESVGTEKGDAAGRAIGVIPTDDDGSSVNFDLADEVSIMLTHGDVSDELGMLLEMGDVFSDEDAALITDFLENQTPLPYRIIARIFIITVLDTELFPLEKIGYGE